MKSLLNSWYKHFKDNNLLIDLEEIIYKTDVLYENTAVYPRKEHMLRAFQECNYNDTKVIMLGEHPYNHSYEGIPSACGLCYAIENGDVTRSIRNVLRSLPSIGMGQQSLLAGLNGKGGAYYKKVVDWPSKGVLMLNTILTTEANNPYSHSLIWEEFMNKFLLSIKGNHYAWLLIGDKVKRRVEFLNLKNKILMNDPASDSYNKTKCFNEVNNLLTYLKRDKIEWYD